ncbi:MAG: hypothetical protein HKL85_08710 [Acidimicrobiaceae bacterium]|jgi:2-phospho-L-lactate guanylyltransferase|nr:hypothetical protein [Acidimicrobiaceae bacterium]
MEPLAIVVPLREFSHSKTRLRRAGVTDVEMLCEEWAQGVIVAGRPRPVYVACESVSIAQFAESLGADVIISDAQGLNEAVQHAHRFLSLRYQTIVVAHGDLRNPVGLGAWEPPAAVTIVVDHHGTGTNVLAVPTECSFQFAFGSDSARRHVHEANRLGLENLTIFASAWAYDVDELEDLIP